MPSDSSHKFRKLLRYAQEIDGCKFQHGGYKTASKGFDEIGLVAYLFQKAFKFSVPMDYNEILSSGKVVDEKETATGDIVVYAKMSGEFLVGVVLGVIQKEVIFSSKRLGLVVIREFTDSLDDHALKACIRLIDRE